MIDVLPLLLAILATYRLATLIAIDDGPFDIFSRMREEVGQATWWGRGMHCPICIGFWISLLAAMAVPGMTLGQLGIWWMAIAGGSALLYRAVKHD